MAFCLILTVLLFETQRVRAFYTRSVYGYGKFSNSPVSDLMKSRLLFIELFCVILKGLELEKANSEAKVEVLSSLSNKVELPGAIFDCIVFHDGRSWRYLYMIYTFRSELDGIKSKGDKVCSTVV